MSKRLQDLLSNPSVQSISDERATGDGIWVYLNVGYHWEQMHQVHEDTITDIKKAVAQIKLCHCSECITLSKGTK